VPRQSEVIRTNDVMVSSIFFILGLVEAWLHA
jgi:hypothetical protein